MFEPPNGRVKQLCVCFYVWVFICSDTCTYLVSYLVSLTTLNPNYTLYKLRAEHSMHTVRCLNIRYGPVRICIFYFMVFTLFSSHTDQFKICILKVCNINIYNEMVGSVRQKDTRTKSLCTFSGHVRWEIHLSQLKLEARIIHMLILYNTYFDSTFLYTNK